MPVCLVVSILFALANLFAHIRYSLCDDENCRPTRTVGVDEAFAGCNSASPHANFISQWPKCTHNFFTCSVRNLSLKQQRAPATLGSDVRHLR